MGVAIRRAVIAVAAFTPLSGCMAFAASPASEGHALTQGAVEIARPFGFPITNSMIVTWIVAVSLIVFAQVATRDMKQVPTGTQNFLEWLIGGLYGFLEGIMGSHLVTRTFWFFATIFIFILSANWFGLIPGVGTIGWGHSGADGFNVDEPLFRGANADLNLTLAMALDRNFEGLIRSQGRDDRPAETTDGGCVFRRWVLGNSLDSGPANFPELSPLRQRVRRREHVGNHVEIGSGLQLADTNSILFFRIAHGLGAGVSLYALDRRLHRADLPA